MNRAVITLALLTVWGLAHGRAQAEGEPTLGKRVDATRDSLSQAASGAQQSARETAASAAERAAEVAERAKERSIEAADGLSERLHDVTDSAREYADALANGAREGVHQLGSSTSDAIAQGKDVAKQAIQSLRDEARAVLIGMADALDNRTRDARRAARAESWERLKTRFHLSGDRPTMKLSEELRDHESRVARLKRAQELATAVDDQSGIARSARLLEREYARHKRRVERLRDSERTEAKR
jgi:predicted RecA/RadA family phage recombinase